MSDKPTISFNSATIITKAGIYGRKVRPYSFIIFLVFAAVLYGMVILKINELSDVQPSEEAIAKQVKSTKLPQIDEKVVAQLKALQDNSVSVQTLFTQARDNPFE